MSGNNLKDRASLQAQYMQRLVNKAKTAAIESIDTVSFDPQGRVLIDVELTDKDYEDIGKSTGIKTVQAVKEQLSNPSLVVSVSLDISGIQELEDKFSQILQKGFPDEHEEGSLSAPLLQGSSFSAPLSQYLNMARGSVIALHEESVFHMAAAKRIITEKLFPGEFSSLAESVSSAFKEAEKSLNKSIMTLFPAMLTKSYSTKKGEVSIAKLNRKLDKARPKMAKAAQKELRRALIRKTGVDITRKGLDRKKLKHLAEETTATANDILYLDCSLKTATYIRGTDKTAHGRKLTDADESQSFAHREIVTHQYLDGGSVTVHPSPRLQIRTPSPVYKDTTVSDADKISDVALKFAEIKREYHLDEILDVSSGEIPRAFVYNRFTAFEHFLDDRFNTNKQTESAQHILRAMHQYNASQISLDADKSVLVFVQNISVNGKGSTLGYGLISSKLQVETTLMAEMTMLHSLYDTLPESSQQSAKQVLAYYKAYLSESPRGDYFSSSTSGQLAIQKIKEIKKQLRSEAREVVSDSSDVMSLAKHALVNFMAHNKHMSHRHAKAIQALSVFVEKASIAGCKSGNERAEAINKRVAMLDAMMFAESSDGKFSSLMQALQSCATHPRDGFFNNTFTKFSDALDDTLNDYGLQSAATVISETDQHAAAKVQRVGGVKITWNPKTWVKALLSKFNANYAESSRMTNLVQEKASKSQAHKGASDYMMEALDPIDEADRELLASEVEADQQLAAASGQQQSLLDGLGADKETIRQQPDDRGTSPAKVGRHNDLAGDVRAANDAKSALDDGQEPTGEDSFRP